MGNTQGYAEVIFRHLLTNPILGTSTVHLHYASRRHYEFSKDVSKVRMIKHISMPACIDVFIIDGNEPMQNDQTYFFSDIFLNFDNILKNII
jgi:hypothetical protein